MARHGVAPSEAEQCYRNDPFVVEEQLVSGEHRILSLGETDAGRRLAFVFTERWGKIRMITAHPMDPQQRQIYEEG